MAARYVFKLIGSHVPDTVKLRNARGLGLTRESEVEGYGEADRATICPDNVVPPLAP